MTTRETRIINSWLNKDVPLNDPDPKKKLLLKKLYELIFSVDSRGLTPKILRLIKDIHTTNGGEKDEVIEFMEIKRHKRNNIGEKTFDRIEEIQKVLAEENKKILKKAPVTTYKWVLETERNGYKRTINRSGEKRQLR